MEKVNNSYYADSVENYYKNRIKTNESELSAIKRKIYIIGTSRLVVFLLTISFAILFRNHSSWLLAGIIIGGTICFSALIVKYNQFQKRKSYLKTSLGCDYNELKALKLDLSPFDGAPEKASASHPYSLDIDLFGNNNSLLQLINRTCTYYGKKTLIRSVLRILNERDRIERRQKVVKELKIGRAHV